MARTKIMPKVGDIWQVQKIPFYLPDGLQIGDSLLILSTWDDSKYTYRRYLCFNLREQCRQLYGLGELVNNLQRIARAPK